MRKQKKKDDGFHSNLAEDSDFCLDLLKKSSFETKAIYHFN